jgi:hypothetical protein
MRRHCTQCFVLGRSAKRETTWPRPNTSTGSYESRAHRDSVNDKVMKDPRMVGVDPKNFPLDAKRMYWGGFEVLVDV